MDADIASSKDLFGRVVTELQSNIQLIGERIGGSLKYIDDYGADSGFDPDDGNHFIALHADADTGTTITVEVLGGFAGPVTLDEDGIVVLQLSSNAEKLKFVATKNGLSQTKIFDIQNVSFEAAEVN